MGLSEMSILDLGQINVKVFQAYFISLINFMHL